MFEDDGLTARFILGLILLTSLHSWSQETCKHCPVGAQLDAQFPAAPSESKPTFTPLFVTAHLLWLGSSVFDVEATVRGENRPCGLVEGNNGFPERVGRKELYAENLGIFAAGSTLDYFIQRSHPPKAFGWLQYMFPAVGTAVHLKGGIEWLQRCY